MSSSACPSPTSNTRCHLHFDLLCAMGGNPERPMRRGRSAKSVFLPSRWWSTSNRVRRTFTP